MAGMDDVHQRLVRLEEDGWRALSSGGAAAREFYDGVLADEVVMVFPGNMRITDRSTVLDSMSGPPWASFEIDNPQVLSLGDDAALVVYHASAQREGSPPYSAQITSGYLRRGEEWRLCFHQQTPD